jgi:hypothetical protein
MEGQLLERALHQQVAALDKTLHAYDTVISQGGRNVRSKQRIAEVVGQCFELLRHMHESAVQQQQRRPKSPIRALRHGMRTLPTTHRAVVRLGQILANPILHSFMERMRYKLRFRRLLSAFLLWKNGPSASSPTHVNHYHHSQSPSISPSPSARAPPMQTPRHWNNSGGGIATASLSLDSLLDEEAEPYRHDFRRIMHSASVTSSGVTTATLSVDMYDDDIGDEQGDDAVGDLGWRQQQQNFTPRSRSADSAESNRSRSGSRDSPLTVFDATTGQPISLDMDATVGLWIQAGTSFEAQAGLFPAQAPYKGRHSVGSEGEEREAWQNPASVAAGDDMIDGYELGP